MPSYAVNTTYLPSQQLAVLKAESRKLRFEYEIIDGITGLSKGLFYDVAPGGSIEYSYLNDIKRTASFTLYENLNDSISRINFLLDSMQVYCVFDFFDAGNQSLRFPVGRFVMSSNERAVEGRLVTRPIEGFDLGKVLRDDTITTRYELSAGQSITNAVATIILGAGIKGAVIDPSSSVMKVTRSWDPGTSKMVIVNDLLDLVGRGSLFFDGMGVARSKAYVAPSAREATISYQTDNESVLSPGYSSNLDLSSVPNQWTFAISQPDQTPITATYQNINPSSPTSIPNRGRIVAFFSSDNQDAATSADLLNKVLKKAAEDSQVYETVSISTLLMPIHDENETVYLYHEDAMVQGYNFSEMAWSLPLDSSAQYMSHSLRRIVPVTIF